MTIADEGGVSYLHHRQKRIPIKKIIIIINIKIDIFIIKMVVVANLSFCNRVPGLTTSLLLGKRAPQDLIMIMMMTMVMMILITMILMMMLFSNLLSGSLGCMCRWPCKFVHLVYS